MIGRGEETKGQGLRLTTYWRRLPPAFVSPCSVLASDNMAWQDYLFVTMFSSDLASRLDSAGRVGYHYSEVLLLLEGDLRLTAGPDSWRRRDGEN